MIHGSGQTSDTPLAAAAGRRAALVACLPALLVCAWRFTPILRRMTDTGDFPAHVRFAQGIAESGRITIPHFGYEAAVIGTRALTPGGNWFTAALIVSLAGQLLTAVILARWIDRALAGQSRAVRLAASALLPLALLTVQPVMALTPSARDPWLIGYFPPNQYHNPTTLLSKPLALALFGAGLVAATGLPPVAAGAVTGLAASIALVVASGLVKPSFLMAFLPAVGLLALAYWRTARWRLVWLGLALPAVVLLAGQFALRYIAQQDDGVHIVFDPLMVIGLFTPTDWVSLSTRLAASVLFPLAVTILFVREASHDRELVLAWLTLAVGVAWGYLMAESGGKASAGDFLWSGQLAVFLLFAVSSTFLLRAVGSNGRALGVSVLARSGVCAAVLLWHVASGVQHLQTSWFD